MQNDLDPQQPKRHPLEEAPRRRHPLEEGPQQPIQASKPPPPGPRAPLQLAAQQPYIMWGLIAINVAVFLVQMLSPALDRQISNAGYQRAYEVLVLGQYYRLISAMFLHLDPAHIFFNMYALYLFGRTLERVAGHTRFAIIYFIGGLTGSVLSVVLDNPSPMLGVPSLGASGAVFAIFAGEMIFLFRNREILGPRAMLRLRSFAIIMLINLGLGVASYLSASAVKIDIWGHVGGFIGGTVLAYLIGPSFAIPEDVVSLRAEDSNPLAGSNLLLVSAYGVGLIAILIFFSLRTG